jgi:hypothetical protein
MTNFTYDAPENHVEQRDCLSPVLRKSLFVLPRERWPQNPGFRGEAEFWTQIHEGLLSASATLAAWSQQALEERDMSRMGQIAPQIKSLGRRLVHHAHGHHHIEDDHFFPMFLRAFPQLQHPLELLDGDHKVLAEVLDSLEKAVDRFTVAPAGSDRQMRDQWLTGADELLLQARRLDTLFIRHIGDEEEICIPAMLQG